MFYANEKQIFSIHIGSTNTNNSMFRKIDWKIRPQKFDTTIQLFPTSLCNGWIPTVFIIRWFETFKSICTRCVEKVDWCDGNNNDDDVVAVTDTDDGNGNVQLRIRWRRRRRWRQRHRQLHKQRPCASSGDNSDTEWKCIRQTERKLHAHSMCVTYK